MPNIHIRHSKTFCENIDFSGSQCDDSVIHFNRNRSNETVTSKYTLMFYDGHTVLHKINVFS